VEAAPEQEVRCGGMAWRMWSRIAALRTTE